MYVFRSVCLSVGPSILRRYTSHVGQHTDRSRVFSVRKILKHVPFDSWSQERTLPYLIFFGNDLNIPGTSPDASVARDQKLRGGGTNFSEMDRLPHTHTHTTPSDCLGCEHFLRLETEPTIAPRLFFFFFFFFPG